MKTKPILMLIAARFCRSRPLRKPPRRAGSASAARATGRPDDALTTTAAKSSGDLSRRGDLGSTESVMRTARARERFRSCRRLRRPGWTGGRGGVKESDILKMLNDQILTEPDQLAKLCAVTAKAQM